MNYKKEYIVAPESIAKFKELGGVIRATFKRYSTGYIPEEEPISGEDRWRLACGFIDPGISGAPRPTIIYKPQMPQ